tara:strand:+ start:5630 stop:6085 length:456 start_codon:yes stop_codon:yes gene_type:complete
MEYILSHLPQTLIVVGLVLLAIEVMVLGFSTFVLFFIGLGSIITGALMAMGVIPQTLMMSLLATAIISSFIAIFTWKPMKRMQNKVEVKQINNDMIGHQFYLSEELALGRTVKHQYSGITWQVKAKEALPVGTEVKIVKMEVGILTVERVS